MLNTLPSLRVMLCTVDRTRRDLYMCPVWSKEVNHYGCEEGRPLSRKRSLSAAEEMKGWSANNYRDCKHINQFISRSNCLGFSAWPVSHSHFHLAATAPDIVSHTAAPQMILIPRWQTVEYFLIGGAARSQSKNFLWCFVNAGQDGTSLLGLLKCGKTV